MLVIRIRYQNWRGGLCSTQFRHRVQANEIHQAEFVFLLLLIFVVGFGTLAQKLKAPYPIVLVIGGLLLSLFPELPHVSLSPDLVFLVMLPPLLFSAAFNTSWRDFRYNLTTVLLLAFGLVGFTTLGVGVTADWLLPGFDWRLGLVLGAVIHQQTRSPLHPSQIDSGCPGEL